jgi:hypothetical protein
VKRPVDRNALEVGELPPPDTKVRVHEHVGLKSAPEATLAPAGAARQRGQLPVILGQERDDAVRITVVDGADE